jgi:hypothetical protein
MSCLHKHEALEAKIYANNQKRPEGCHPLMSASNFLLPAAQQALFPPVQASHIIWTYQTSLMLGLLCGCLLTSLKKDQTFFLHCWESKLVYAKQTFCHWATSPPPRPNWDLYTLAIGVPLLPLPRIHHVPSSRFTLHGAHHLCAFPENVSVETETLGARQYHIPMRDARAHMLGCQRGVFCELWSTSRVEKTSEKQEWSFHEYDIECCTFLSPTHRK